jgi:hypothetical protein
VSALVAVAAVKNLRTAVVSEIIDPARCTLQDPSPLRRLHAICIFLAVLVHLLPERLGCVPPADPSALTGGVPATNHRAARLAIKSQRCCSRCMYCSWHYLPTRPTLPLQTARRLHASSASRQEGRAMHVSQHPFEVGLHTPAHVWPSADLICNSDQVTRLHPFDPSYTGATTPRYPLWSRNRRSSSPP